MMPLFWGKLILPVKKTSFADHSARSSLWEWGGLLLVAVGCWGLGSGAYESLTDMHWPFVILAVVLAIAAVHAGMGLIRDRVPETFVAMLAAPLIWTVFACLLFRVVAPYAPQAIILPVLLLGTFFIIFPLKIAVWPLLLLVGVEGGLWYAGSQGVWSFLVNGSAYVGASLGFYVFADSRAYCRRLRERVAVERRESRAKEYAKDLGFDEPPPAVAEIVAVEDEGVGDSLSTVETVVTTFELQLEIIRRALSLRSAVLFWPDASGSEYKLRAMAGDREEMRSGPFPRGAGIFGILQRSGVEVAMSGLTDYAGLPYYRRRQEVGAVFAIVVADSVFGGDGKRHGVLCVDREGKEEWATGELEFLRLAARKLGLNVSMGRRLCEMDRDRSIVAQVVVGLRELNGVLDLASAFDATISTVRGVLAAEFVAISLKEGECHRIARAEGIGAEGLAEQEFCKDDGLVGQAMARNRVIPTNGVNRTAAPIFSSSKRVADFKSLLIVPLHKEDGGSVGALVVAARAAGVFSRQGRQILELIATQVAIKIDLARAHEKINRLATTDGLTGLANHRTFQHGFDVMLQRAERQQKPLCMLLCDIDHFKGVNDTFGHPFGDLVLKEVAKVLAESVRQVDLAARYGGEEFAILLEDCDEKGGHLLAERIRQAVGELALACEKVTVAVTLSIGLASYPQDGMEKPDLIARADQALYRAKEEGRNRTVLWSHTQRQPKGTGEAAA
ncbi:MAG: sensor domain-containing diguanylate cyclase [Desulfobulbaceae bacterium]|nr:sensor domain-containing diguanylate cyclase [Desulfobulbaceae bacterium]